MAKSILITAPFGGAFKNFLSNESFIDALSKEYEIHILTPLSEAQVAALVSNEIRKKVSIISQELPKTDKLKSTIAFISTYAFNKYIKSATSEVKSKSIKLTHFQRFMIGLLYLSKMFWGWQKVYRWAERKKYRLYRNRKTANILSRLRPDLVFCSAASFEPDFFVVTEAIRAGYPTSGMVFSWDNLSSKGPIYSSFKKIIAWNGFQKDELKKYYRYDDKNIRVIGMPQLDYLSKNISRISVGSFRSDNRIPKGVRLITYTTGTPKTIPNENLVVETVYSYLKQLKEPWHLRVRLHPKDDPRYYRNLQKLKNVSLEVVGDTRRLKARDGRCLTPKSVDHYISLLKSSDVVLNIASTVTLESLAAGTPVIHIAIDPQPCDYYRSNVRFYDYTHIRQLSSFGAVPIVKTGEELIKALEMILNDKDYLYAEREHLVAELTGASDGKAGERLAKELINNA